MRGDDDQQEGIYISPEKRVLADHPLGPIRKIGDEILKEMSPKFAKLCSDVGRPSIVRERLLRSLLLQIFNSVRSERMPIEHCSTTYTITVTGADASGSATLTHSTQRTLVVP
jgi:hypothetical protein